MEESPVLRSSSIEELDKQIPPELLLRIVSPEEVTHILKLADAFWMYDGEPCAEKPHALLASGNHSNGFVMVGPTIKKYTGIRALFAHSLAFLTMRECCQERPYWTVGADTSSTALAGDVAKIFDAYHVRMKKVELTGGKAEQVWSEDNNRTAGVLHSRGLQVEELITTAKSALDVRKGMEAVNPSLRKWEYFSVLPTIVNRSDPRKPVEFIDGSLVASLLRLKISNFDPGAETCPYCAAGSVALKPKEGGNWVKFKT
jgi:hypothetical protein